jgi:membrane-associated phospholipid phosphatase
MTQSSPHLIHDPHRLQIFWRPWLIFWIIAALLLAALLSFDGCLDTFLWCSTRWAAGDSTNKRDYIWTAFRDAHAADPTPAFYMTEPPPMNSQFWRRTEAFWTVCKCGGDALWVVPPVLILIALFCRRQPLLAWFAACGITFSGFLSWFIRSIDGRFRPTHTDGANHWELFRGFDWQVKNLSFPSGHATLAFAAAATLTYAFPKFRIVYISLAILTGISRVVQQAHFWSDVLSGATLGWSIAWFTMYYGERRLHTNKNP